MPLRRHSKAKASMTDSSGFKVSVDDASSAAVMLKTLQRLNRVR
jgi:hypothetical protein